MEKPYELIKKYGKLDLNKYHVNLLGVRYKSNVNSFNDKLYIIRNIITEVEVREITNFTTDPGLYYLSNPTNSSGTAILKPGFYKNLWQIGKHKNKYKALVQVNPCTVYRDTNKDNKLDKGKESTGIFGINLHRANEVYKSTIVDKWSAGCQVVADPKDFKMLLDLCDTAVNNGQKFFSYTLVDSDEI
jgi:hypothetical protein